MKRQSIIILTAILALMPSLALASFATENGGEYITWNALTPIANAFEKIGYIFANPSYRGLFGAVAVAGIVFSGFAFYFTAITTGKGGKDGLGMLSWAWGPIIGIVIYLAFIIPTQTLVIHDEVLNRTRFVGGIPKLIAVLASSVNRVETGILDIMESTADPIDPFTYRSGAGGLTYLQAKAVIEATVADPYMSENVSNYIADCVLFELTRPGTTLTEESLTASKTGMATGMALAASPAVYTMLRADATTSAQPQTCRDSWDTITAYYANDDAYRPALYRACSQSLARDPKDPSFEFNFLGGGLSTDVQSCVDSINEFIVRMWLPDGSVSTEELMKNAEFANIFYHVVRTGGDPSIASMASRSIATSGYGFGIAANEWIPAIKGTMTAIIVCMIPILVIFLPTPLFGKVISTIFGFFLWLTLWSLTDFMIHQIATEYATTYFANLKMQGLSVEAMLNFPDQATKILSMFGFMRSAAMTIATVICGVLVKFAAGQAMASLAGTIGGDLRAGGSAGASAALTPEGQNRTIGGLLDAAASSAMHSNAGFDFRSAADAKANSMMANTYSGAGYGNMANAKNAAMMSTGQGMNRTFGVDDAVGGDYSKLREQARMDTSMGLERTAGAYDHWGANPGALQGASRTSAEGDHARASATAALAKSFGTSTEDIQGRMAMMDAFGKGGDLAGKEAHGGTQAELARSFFKSEGGIASVEQKQAAAQWLQDKGLAKNDFEAQSLMESYSAFQGAGKGAAGAMVGPGAVASAAKGNELPGLGQGSRLAQAPSTALRSGQIGAAKTLAKASLFDMVAKQAGMSEAQFARALEGGFKTHLTADQANSLGVGDRAADYSFGINSDGALTYSQGLSGSVQQIKDINNSQYDHVSTRSEIATVPDGRGGEHDVIKDTKGEYGSDGDWVPYSGSATNGVQLTVADMAGGRGKLSSYMTPGMEASLYSNSDVGDRKAQWKNYVELGVGADIKGSAIAAGAGGLAGKLFGDEVGERVAVGVAGVMKTSGEVGGVLKNFKDTKGALPKMEGAAGGASSASTVQYRTVTPSGFGALAQ